MNKGKKAFLIIGIILVIILLLGVVLNSYIKSEIKDQLHNGMANSSLQYDEIQVNVWQGNTSLTNPIFSSGGIKVEAKKVRMLDFSYTSYIFNKEIVIGQIVLEEPKFTINKDTTTSENKNKDPEERELRIKKLSLDQGSLRIIENDSAQNSLFVSLKALTVNEINLNQAASPGSLPFTYENYSLETDSLYFDMNSEHYLTIDEINHDEGGGMAVSNLKMVPKYNRADFDRQVPYEKDRVELKIPETSIKDFTWDMEQDSLVIKSPSIRIREASLNIYRNKLLTDDTRIKPLYSKMLRELGIKIRLDTVKIEDAQIVYEEKVLQSRPPGTLWFDNVKVDIYHVSNIGMDSEDFKETKVEAEAVFMKENMVSFTYTFDVSNTLDQFTIKGHLGEISAEAVNPFLKPAMNVEIEGKIESMFFNFYGNNQEAKGDMQLAYQNFKVNILKDGEEKRKSFLSGLTNLFLKNDRVNEDIEQKDIHVDRDKTKSFWNFLWLAIRDGAIKTFL